MSTLSFNFQISSLAPFPLKNLRPSQPLQQLDEQSPSLLPSLPPSPSRRGRYLPPLRHGWTLLMKARREGDWTGVRSRIREGMRRGWDERDETRRRRALESPSSLSVLREDSSLLTPLFSCPLQYLKSIPSSSDPRPQTNRRTNEGWFTHASPSVRSRPRADLLRLSPLLSQFQFLCTCIFLYFVSL